MNIIFNNITLTKMSENTYIINIPEKFVSFDKKRHPEYIFQTNIDEGCDIEMGFPKNSKSLPCEIPSPVNPIIKVLNHIFIFMTKKID